MRSLGLMTLVMAAGFLAAADDPKEVAAKKEREKLQGRWKVVSAECEGKPDAAAKQAAAAVTADGKFSIKLADGSGGDGSYKLDPAQKPKAIEYTPDYGPHKGKVFLGIYTLEGDTLKLCISDPGKERPKEFVTKAGSGTRLLVLQRDKPPAPAPSAPPAPVSPFQDKTLEAAVRTVLQEAKAPLTDKQLANVYLLEAPAKNIKDLTGLEKCKNLALLKLSNNQIADLAPLKGLTSLQSLDLSRNQITDIGPLSGLTKLQYLEFSDNHISKLDALGSLTNLSALYLTNNQISDLSPLGNLTKLSSLSLGRNRIKDISSLAKITRLMTLELKDNQIGDLSALEKQTELSLLMLERNKIKDLTPLVQAAKADAQGEKRFAPYLRVFLAGNPLTQAAKTKQVAAWAKTFSIKSMTFSIKFQFTLTEAANTQVAALKSYGVKVEQ